MNETAGETLFGSTLRAYLTGRWRIKRAITDRKGPNGVFSGCARFEAAGPDVLDYVEEGTLSLSDMAMKATRRYRWHTPSPLTAEVYFDDGRFFHSIQLRKGCAETRHFCAPDTYHVGYFFTGKDCWTQQWCVSGPRKDYVSDTVFSRIS